MNTNALSSFFSLALLLPYLAIAQPCGTDEVTAVVDIQTDNWGFETAWLLQNAVSGEIYAQVDFGDYDNNSFYSTQVCIPESACVEFLIYDEFGDGIPGTEGYTLSVNGDTVSSGNSFGYSEYLNFNCDQGNVCSTALPVSEGAYQSSEGESWYFFTANATGSYLLSTCFNENNCNTKIWVYGNCDYQQIAEDNTGTIFYNDDNPQCGELAEILFYIEEGVSYFIRIGDSADNCAGTPIHWSITFQGATEGCTDPTACNYNPLATIDDGSCLPQGDPDCPDSPDLVLRQDVLETSVYLTTLEADDECLVNEGCLTGTGLRDIIRFTTHIENNGQTDYFIGHPGDNPDQFTYDNCHFHYHYDGYAEYLLFDEYGTALPIGFKNGFCVLDLVCDNGGFPQYSCNFMGISMGCGDVYHSSLDCQWVDVTDVPDGDYQLVTRVNWDNAPDALGRLESDTLNNWAQVCINLDRSTDTLVMTLLELCEPYVDCAGVLYGSTQPDCAGECGGPLLMGDLDGNGVQTMLDAENYIALIVNDDITPTPCNDLYADSNITVYDVALLTGCLNFGAGHTHQGGGSHNHCNFPSGLLNVYDTVSLTILEYDPAGQYIDIGMNNPTCEVVAYLFDVSGLFVTSIDNLVDPAMYPISPTGSNNGLVVGLSYEDSTIVKSNGFEPLCRIHYSAITEPEICLSEIIDIVNDDYQQTITRIEGGCITIVGTTTPVVDLGVRVEPNPFDEYTLLTFNNPDNQPFNLTLIDVHGRTVRQFDAHRSNQFRIERGGLPLGVYWYRLSGEQGGVAAGRVVVE